MTDPVDTDALRQAGNRADYYQTGEGDLWRAAADKLERLRKVIEDAPHDDTCLWPHGDDHPDADGSACDCWKGDAL